MAPRSAHRARTSGLALLAGCGVALVHWGSLGPAFSVKGSWEGEPSTLTRVVKGDLSTLGAGLEPHVKFSAVTYNREGLSLSVEDGRLNANYNTALDKDTQLNFRVNDEQAWKASFLGHDASLRVRGQGTDLG
eukprot:CAMPEP_0204030384 /NCGR_PEP_ID=MMETSP0360-20130528/58911_1 /ASSEMBLY_ACC=CAM_ASM_000342 /TAXON_ID=268821 /ORGANISM="Scrippsiella Hangoei, Strain SHTV-5" /LENGTH=132 /DNA_ID=CAMNT_0050974457 /DNA_START=56 /DNA_END=451 /DNA_ORIENTATION=-